MIFPNTPSLILVLLAAAAAAHSASSDSPPPLEVTLSPMRSEIVLNGRWRFQPAQGGRDGKIDPHGWGTISVPGSWAKNGGGAVPNNPTPPPGAAWDAVAEASTAWYQREVEIPAGWAGRAIVLAFDRVSTDAEVTVNGRKCGEIRWPYGEVDITGAVEAGQSATILVHVVATPDTGERIQFMGYAQEDKIKAELQSAGITGDVILESRPLGAHVSDVFVQPSFREKAVTLDVELRDVTRAGPVTVAVRMLDERGEAERSFTSTATVEAKPTQTLQFTWPWDSPRLWDLDQPNLYVASVAVKGAGLDDDYPQMFGFREHWVEGRKFLLNGTEIRWRPITWHGTSASSDSAIAPLKELGFNISQIWPVDQNSRGHVDFWGLWADVSSRAGWPIIGVVQSMSQPFIFDAKGGNDNWARGGREDWTRIMTADLRRMRNYPSIMMWGTSPNISNLASDQNPRYLGQKSLTFAEGGAFPEVEEGLALAKAVDPTRPIFVHAGGRLGDVFTVNHYLNLLPLQEREEWLTDYQKFGDVPYLAVEFGTPLNITMNRGRAGFGASLTSEPWMTEFASIYFGSDAYRWEERDYRRNIRFGYKGPNDGWSADWNAMMRIQSQPDNFQKLNALFFKRTWRSWRMAGLSGGMIPWNFVSQNVWARPLQMEGATLSPFGQRGPHFDNANPRDVHFFEEKGGWMIGAAAKVLAENNRDTLSFVAGSADAPYRKDHNFRAAETIEKQAVLINDARGSADFTAKWTVLVDNKEVATHEESGNLAPSETKFLPISALLPAPPADGKVDGEIVLETTIGSVSHDDRFAFRVFPAEPSAPAFAGSSAIAVYDPVGKSSAMLKTLGITFSPWDGKLDAKLVVIGREALSSSGSMPVGMEEYVARGGHLLILTQRPEWLENSYGFRVSKYLTRRVFPGSPDHPLLAGLDAQDLRDWRGSSTLVDPKPIYEFNTIPSHGWRWGATGTVTSAAIEKPHLSGWRPILECEFDLAYSPLMELDFGRGRVTLCTLDLEDNVPLDPVADLLARRIVERAASTPPLPRAHKTWFFGDDAPFASLEKSGLEVENTTTVPSSGLLISGPGSGLTLAQARQYAQRGNKVLFLAEPKAESTAPAPLTLARSFHGSATLPTHPAAAGISLSDLRIRSELDWRVLDAEKIPDTEADGLLAFETVGSGLVAFTQLSPAALDADKNVYYRFSRWRQTRALNQLIANLGGTFVADAKIFSPMTVKIDLAGPWKFKLITPLPNHKWDNPHPDPGISPAATDAIQADFDDSQWTEVTLPGWIPALEENNGEYVVRKEIKVPPEWENQTLIFAAGRIKSYDSTFWNGKRVGSTGADTKDSWNQRRRYRVLGTYTKPGKTTLAIRAFATDFQGGIHGPTNEMFISLIATEKNASFYSADYIDDQEMGDNPYRYYRW